MKNLKRVLSLGLASVMLLGMMVMGASAATFSDSKDIENDEAVNMMVSLNIINGKDDGRFDPTGTVTRGEMAKMITVALNGGVAPVLGTTSVSYTDTANHWARNFIEYCTNLKIVSGRGNGTFDPNGAVTGSEAAKMILVAMGYQSDWFGFTGADWELNTNREANNATLPGGGVRSLYDGLPSNFNPSAALSRDDAAQMIYNGVRGETMEQSNVTTGGTNGTTYSYSKSNKSILNTKYNITTEYGTLIDVTYDKDEKVFSYAVDTGKVDDKKAPIIVNYDDVADDVSDLFMQQVQIVLDKDGDVMGITSYKSNVLASVAIGDLPSSLKASSTSVKVNGTTYRFENNGKADSVTAYNFLQKDEDAGTLDTLNVKDSGKQGYTVDLIDTNDNGRIDLVVVHPFAVYEVTFVGKTTFSAGGTYKFDESTVYDGIAKGDFAIVTDAKYSATNMPTIEKAEVMTGTVSQIKSGDRQVKVGSTWYTAIDGTAFAKFDTVNKEYDMVVVNGYIFSGKEVEGQSASIKDAVYVTKVDRSDNDPFDGKSQKVQLLFTDGTKKIVTVVKVNGLTGEADKEGNKWTTDIAVGELYTYKTNKDGNYELTSIDADDFKNIKGGENTAIAINDKKATAGDDTKKGDGTFYFNDNAIVFVTADSGKTVEVLSGADVNKWSRKNDYKTTTAAGNVLYGNPSNGFTYVELGVLNLAETKIPNATGKTLYGYVTAKASYWENSDDEGMLEMTFWNGEEEVTISAESLTASGTEPKKADEDSFKGGVVIKYDDLGSTIGNVEIVSKDGKADAITAYEDGKIQFEGATDVTEVNDDAVIFYVDTAKHVGAEGGAISASTQDTADAWIKNVYVWTKEGDDKKQSEIEFMIVDTSNSLGINDDVTIAFSDKTVVTAIDDEKHTATVATGTTIDALIAAVEGAKMENFGGAKVVLHEQHKADNKANVESNDVLHITGTDGTDHYFTITLE